MQIEGADLYSRPEFRADRAIPDCIIVEDKNRGRKLNLDQTFQAKSTELHSILIAL